MSNVKITLTVSESFGVVALRVARDFLANYGDNHRDKNAFRHGVLFTVAPLKKGESYMPTATNAVCM